MSAIGEVPSEVVALADERSRARESRDFASADRLRDRISELGYVVTDAPAGYALAPRPPFEVFAAVADVLAAELVLPEAACTVGLIVDGWPADVTSCVRSIVEHCTDDVVVVGIDCGNVDGAGVALRDLVASVPDRVIDLHLSKELDQVGWSSAVSLILALSRSDVVAIIDMSTRFDADALSPILTAMEDPSVVASGWRGVNVDLADDWRSVVDAGPGEVDAVLGYLMVVRRDVGLDVPPHPKARFYRNADIEWSLAMRAAGGRIVVPDAGLPLRQERHHGYHDSDPSYRDRESRKNYDRILQRFRGQPAILAPRA